MPEVEEQEKRGWWGRLHQAVSRTRAQFAERLDDALRALKEANLIVLLTSVIALSAVVYTFYAGLQWSEIRKSVEVTRESLERSQRPWVGVSQKMELLEPVQFGPRNIVLRSGIALKNFGPSAASHVIVAAGLAPSHDEIDSTIKFVCNAASQLSKGETGPGALSFTDLAVRGRGFVLFPNQQLVEPFESTVPSSRGLTTIYVLGCIAYRDQFNITHRTRFCFEAPVSQGRLQSNFVYCHVYNDAD